LASIFIVDAKMLLLCRNKAVHAKNKYVFKLIIKFLYLSIKLKFILSIV